MEENVSDAKGGSKLKSLLSNFVASIIMNIMRLFAVGQSGIEASEEEEEPKGGLNSLLRRVKSQPVMAVIGALILFTIVGLVVYPRTVGTPPPPTAVARSKVAASPTAPSQGSPTPGVQAANAPSAEDFAAGRPGTTPIQVGTPPVNNPSAKPVVPAVPTTTPLPPGAVQGSPPPPPPTLTPPINKGGPGQPVPTVRPGLPPGVNPPAYPGPTSPPVVNPVAPASSAATPAATPTPAATNTPTITPTPGPATYSIAVPVLQGGNGFYYIINARTGTIAANWKVNSGTGQLFLYQGTPFGGGSGTGGTPIGGSISQSNISSSASIVPFDVTAGTYTLYFFSGAVNSTSTSSASATYIAEPGSVVTPVSGTPTPTAASGATPTPTPIGQSSTATPTSTPAAPTATRSAYP